MICLFAEEGGSMANTIHSFRQQSFQGVRSPRLEISDISSLKNLKRAISRQHNTRGDEKIVLSVHYTAEELKKMSDSQRQRMWQEQRSPTKEKHYLLIKAENFTRQNIDKDSLIVDRFDPKTKKTTETNFIFRLDKKRICSLKSFGH